MRRERSRYNIMARRRKRNHSSARIRRRARRRSFRRFIFRVITVMLIICAGAAALTLFFKVENVEVQGETRYTVEQIRQTLGVEAGDNLFFCGKNAGVERLYESYPYLSTVSVKRKLPDTLIVTVSDCIPVATIRDKENTAWLIDRWGKVLESTQDLSKYPQIVGVTAENVPIGSKLGEQTDKPEPEAADEQVQVSAQAATTQNEQISMLLLLLDALAESERIGRVDFMNLTRLYDVHIGYDGRFDVQLGSLEELDRKLRFLDTIIDEKLSPSDICVIDLSASGAASAIPTTPEKIAQASGIEEETTLEAVTTETT